jgi:hypothetical protein
LRSIGKNRLTPRIVILGAKPGAIVPAGDAIYCANAAFLSAPQAAADFAQRVVVASSTIMAKGLPGSNSAIYRRKLDAIRDYDATELVLFEDPGRGDKLEAILAYLGDSMSTRPIRIVPVPFRTQMVQDLVGRYPLLNAEFRRQPIAVQWRDALEIGRWWIGRQLGNHRRDVRAKYRPSTGILALMVAMTEHGENAEYILAGIGLGERNAYQIGGKTLSNGRKQRSAGLPIHTAADAIALRRMNERFTLSSTEPELHGIVKAFD